MRATTINTLDFKPAPGLSSPHLQMLLANYGPKGKEPPSASTIITLSDGDQLCCEVSTPPSWRNDDKTIVIVHGIGGSHQSPYMIRLSRKFYHAGLRVVRVNLRGAGSGQGLNKLPYNCGTSQDVWDVICFLKKNHPQTRISVLGFSGGGSVVLKMAGERKDDEKTFIDAITVVCPVLDLTHTVNKISLRSNWIYHQMYLSKILEQGGRWIGGKTIDSIRSFDEQVTAPLWGYAGADDYYEKCSAYHFLPKIDIPCHILLAADDPFIDATAIKHLHLPKKINAWITDRGGHMGYIGRGNNLTDTYWMDKQLLEWLAT